MALFGIALEFAVIRPILGQPAFSIVMLTIGIGYVARGAITMIPNVGTETHTLPVPYRNEIVEFGGAQLGRRFQRSGVTPLRSADDFLEVAPLQSERADREVDPRPFRRLHRAGVVTAHTFALSVKDFPARFVVLRGNHPRPGHTRRTIIL